MTTIEFVLADAPLRVGIYTIARSITNESIMQLRQRVANGPPLVKFDISNFPLEQERSEHYEQICSLVNRLADCNCEFQLYYRVTTDDDAEQISLEQMRNLLETDVEYESQEYD